MSGQPIATEKPLSPRIRWPFGRRVRGGANSVVLGKTFRMTASATAVDARTDATVVDCQRETHSVREF